MLRFTLIDSRELQPERAILSHRKSVGIKFLKLLPEILSGLHEAAFMGH